MIELPIAAHLAEAFRQTSGTRACLCQPSREWSIRRVASPHGPLVPRYIFTGLLHCLHPKLKRFTYQFPEEKPLMNERWKLSLRTVCVVAAFTLAVTAVPTSAFALDDNGNGNAYGKNKKYPYGTNQTSSRPYSIGLWGDLPYSQSQADAIPSMIED